MNPKTPNICVILLNWNNYPDTADCLHSLGQISYPNVQVVVVDNHSSDGSNEALKRDFPHCAHIQNDDNLGYARGNNVGIRYALDHGADYVLLLNNDTLVDPGFLEPMVDCLKSNPDAGMAGGMICYASDPQRIWTIGGDVRLYKGGSVYYGQQEPDTGQYDRPIPLTHISGCMALIKKEVFDRVGLICEQYFLRGSEWDLCLRVHRAGFKMYFVPRSKIRHKVSRSIPRFTPADIYDGYRAKLIFTRNFMSYPVWRLWRLMFSIYALGLAPRKFQKLSVADGYPMIPAQRYRKAIRLALKDGLLETPITSSDIQRIKAECI